MDETIKKQLESMNQQVKELTAIYHRVASSHSISDNEFWVWYALLIVNGEYSQQDICDLWLLPKQTVNSVVTNLTKKGFLTLKPVPGTRNRKIICLTEAGQAYGEAIVANIYQAEQRTLEKLSEQERQLGIALFGRYIALLKEDLDEK